MPTTSPSTPTSSGYSCNTATDSPGPPTGRSPDPGRERPGRPSQVRQLRCRRLLRRHRQALGTAAIQLLIAPAPQRGHLLIGARCQRRALVESSMSRRLIIPLVLLCSLLSPTAWATINAAEAMNLSGMQRMLSQRIAKSYLMLGAEIRHDLAKQQLDQSIAKFESNYLALSEYAPTPEIRNALQEAGTTRSEER